MKTFGESKCTYELGRLTKIGSLSLTYDHYGNRLSKGSVKYSYTRGRLLASVDKKASFVYDHEGKRYQKITEDYETTYYYDGEKLIGEDRDDGIMLRYFYDADGGVSGFRIIRNGNAEDIIYVKNIFGDIVYLTNNYGVPLVRYYYDAWGNVKTECFIDGAAIYDELNPFRYRGYYYDRETELYYLLTRYYDPATATFLTPDSIKYLEPESVGGVDLYAYCGNNPVMYVDPTGHFPILAFILGLTAVAGIALSIAGVATNNNTLTAIGLTMVSVAALFSGGLSLSLLTPVGIAVGGFTLATGIGTGLFASSEWQQTFTGNNWMLDAGMSKELYNTLMLTTASLATMGTVASGVTYSLKISKILQVGKIGGVRASQGYPGIRFIDKSGAIRSLELHFPHNGHGLHLQLNNWWLNKRGYVGKYYRAFSKHLEIFKFWKGWF